MSRNRKIVPVVEFEADSPVPLHYQLSTGIQEYLRKHRCKAGSVLLSERALSDHLKLSRNTVRKAYASLQDDEVIERRPGAGTYMLPRSLKNHMPENRIRQLVWFYPIK